MHTLIAAIATPSLAAHSKCEFNEKKNKGKKWDKKEIVCSLFLTCVVP